MVRFSDMLSGDGEPDDAGATTAPRDLPPLVDDAPPDPDGPLEPALDATPDEPPAAEADTEPAPSGPSPQDVLDRLTQYATATRAAAATVPEREPEPDPEPEPVAPSAATPVEPAPPAPTPTSSANTDDTGDDLLPRGKRSLRNPRGKRRDG